MGNPFPPGIYCLLSSSLRHIMDDAAIRSDQQVRGFVLSTHHSQGANNNNSAGQRRERDPRAHSPNQYYGATTGQLPPLNTGRSYTSSFDFEGLITSLRDLFVRDRQMASQADNRRCGICYLYATTSELHYREEEGFYVCAPCERALGKQTLPMIRRQQK